MRRGRRRDLLRREYRSPTIVSIAAVGELGRSFSADTGMGEVLVVATRGHRVRDRDGSDDGVLYVKSGAPPSRHGSRLVDGGR